MVNLLDNTIASANLCRDCVRVNSLQTGA